MQKSKFTKLLCLVLSLVMILSAAPITTFAASADWVFPTYDYSKSPYSSTGKISFDVVIRNTNKDYSYVVTAISITDGFNLTSADLPFTVSAEGSQTVNVAATVSSKVPGSLTFTYNVVDASAAVIDEGLSDTLYFNANKGLVTDSELSVGGQSGISCTYPKVIYATSVEELCNTTIVMENTGSTAVTGLMTTKQSNLKTCFIGDYIAFAKTEVNIPAHGKTTVKMFETTSAYDALTAEQKATLWNSLCTATYSGVDWPYVRYGGYFAYGLDQSTTYVTNITVVLFEDYGLKDMLAQEEAMHRQARDYDCKNGEWDTYMTALYNAATFFYEARVAGTWAGTGSTSSVRKIKDYAEALAAAIENLDKCYVPPVTHTHTFENGVCTDCGFKCTHTFENHVCTVCGMADKITNGELLALVGEQKFVSSTGIVFRAAENEIGNYNLYFDKSALTMVPVSAKDVEVTSYGYKLTSTIHDGAGGYIDNYYEFYFDGTGFTKLVCSNLVKAVRNDTYLPYHPVTQVSARAATCTENGYTTSYWICTDAGCGKAFTDNTCATEIPAATLATYIIPATGHDFTGDYVPGTGDNVGKHARKCVNTGCTAVGLETTANAYEACTGMEDDFTCDVCGYYDAATAIAAARTEAKATLNALAEGASNAVKTIVAKAVEDIEAAESESAITTIVANAESEVAAQKEQEAAELAAAKTEAKATVNALASDDDSDEVKEIIEKALADIENAKTEFDAFLIASRAEDDVAEQRAIEAAAALDAAKDEAKATVNALAEGASDAVKAIVAKAVENIEAAANESAVNSIVADAKNKVNAQKNLENVIATKKAELSATLAEAKCDEAKEILTKALADLENVTDLNSVYSISGAAIGTAKGKDGEYTGMLNAYKNAFTGNLTGNSYAEADNYLDYIIPALENTTSLAALKELIAAEEPMIEFYCGKERANTRYAGCLEYNGLTDETKALIAEAVEKILASETPDEFKAVCEEYDMPIYVASLKDKDTYNVLALATENDSEEVTAIIEKGLADIEKAATLDDVDAAYAAAYYAVAAQRQLEAEALAEAKAEAAAAVELLGTGDDSDEVAAIIEKALADIEKAESITAVEAIADTAAEDVADQRAAEALAEAKEEAKAAVEALAADGDSDEVAAIIEKALADIEDAEDIEAVEALAAAAEKAVADQKAAEAAAAALAEAKEEAKAAVEALAADDDSDEVKAIIEKALADIEAAEDIEAVEAIADTAAEDVADQKAAEEAAAEEAAAEAAKALAEAKEAAKAAIDAAIEADDNEAVTAVAEEAKAAIENADSIEKVEEIMNIALESMEDARGRCPYCGEKEHDSLFSKLACFAKRIISLFVMVVEFIQKIVSIG